MKKLTSFIAAIAMVATMFTSAVYADADVTFTSADSAMEYEGVTYVTITTTIDAPNGFAGFKTILTYDTEAFTFLDASGSANLGDVTVATPAGTNNVVCTYGSATDKMPTVKDTKPPFKEVAQVYEIYYNFMLNEDAYNGDYVFGYTSDDENLANAALKQLVSDTTGASATVTITTGKAPVEEKTPAELVPAKENNKVEGAEFYTQGFMATVNTNDQIVNEVSYELSCVGYTPVENSGVKGSWNVSLGKGVTATYAINVLNVPANDVVECAWDFVAADAE